MQELIDVITLAYKRKWNIRRPKNGAFVFKYNNEYFYFEHWEIPDRLFSIIMPDNATFNTVEFNGIALIYVPLAQRLYSKLIKQCDMANEKQVLSYPDCDFCGSIRSAKYKTADNKNICDCCLANTLKYNKLTHIEVVNRYVIRKGPFINFAHPNGKRKIFLPEGFVVTKSKRLPMGSIALDLKMFPKEILWFDTPDPKKDKLILRPI